MLCRQGWPRSPRDSPASASPVAGIKGVCLAEVKIPQVLTSPIHKAGAHLVSVDTVLPCASNHVEKASAGRHGCRAHGLRQGRCGRPGVGERVIALHTAQASQAIVATNCKKLRARTGQGPWIQSYRRLQRPTASVCELTRGIPAQLLPGQLLLSLAQEPFPVQCR